MSVKFYDTPLRETRCCYLAAFLLVIFFCGCGASRTAGIRGAAAGTLRGALQLDTVIPFTHTVTDISRVIISGDAGSTWIYNDQDWKTTNRIVLLRMQEQSGQLDSIILTLPQDTAIDRRGSVADIAVDRDRIAVLFWKAVVFYDRAKLSSPNPSPRAVALSYPYKQIALVGGRCLVGLCHLGAREYGDHYTFAAGIDPVSGKVAWETPLPDPDGFQFTSFVPRRVMEFTGDGIWVTDVARYRIVLYDSTGQPHGELTRHIADWESRYDSSFRRYRPLVGRVPYAMKSLLDTVRPYLSKMYMIRLIDAVDDSTIMVAWQAPDKHTQGRLKGLEKVYYDIWRKRRGTWELHAQDLPDFNPQWTDSFATERMFPLFWTYYNVGNSRIALLDPLPRANLTTQTYGDIRKALDSAIAEGEPPFSLIYLKVLP